MASSGYWTDYAKTRERYDLPSAMLILSFWTEFSVLYGKVTLTFPMKSLKAAPIKVRDNRQPLAIIHMSISMDLDNKK